MLHEGVELPTAWARQLINLAGLPAVNNNPVFALRFQWQFNAANDTGRVDNIRVFLTVLVVLHHLMITYAGSGSWYYLEPPQDFAAIAVGSWTLSVNQAFFMGLFLFIGAQKVQRM